MNFNRIDYKQAVIAGINAVDAPDLIQSRDIEARLAPLFAQFPAYKGLLDNYVGIHSRRFFPADVQPTDAATMAAKRLIETDNIDPNSIDLLITTSVSRDCIEPALASIVHGKLGLGGHCLNFDVGSACMGFMNAMQVAAAMIENGMVRRALLVSGENSRYMVESTIKSLSQAAITEEQFKYNFATLTLGSSAVAMLMGHVDDYPDKPRLESGITLADGSKSYLCSAQNEGMHCDSTGLFNAGMALLAELVTCSRQALQWDPQTRSHLFFHQVNAVYTNTFAKQIGVEPSKIPVVYPEYGNIGPCSIPLTFYKAKMAGELVSDNRVSFVCIGSGINCALLDVVC